MNQLNTGTAYICWCLCFFGFCGVQRLYVGQTGVGLLYLLTLGLFGVGQFFDLFAIPDMVEKRNAYLRGSRGDIPRVNQSVTVNIGEIPQLKQLAQSSQVAEHKPLTPAPVSPMQKLLKAAKDNGGKLSVAQAAMHTELEPDRVKELLQEAVSAGYADMGNDPETGAIRYYFDV